MSFFRPKKPNFLNFPNINKKKTRYFLLSPRIARIKASSKYEKNPEKSISKIKAIHPTLPGRISTHSPVCISPPKSPISNTPGPRSRKLFLISSKNKVESPSGTPPNISIPSSPIQDLSFFIDHLLDIFSSAEAVVEYYFIERESPLKLEDFLLSCQTLGITEAYQSLRKIFLELEKENALTDQVFLNKLIQTRNSAQISGTSKSSVFRKRRSAEPIKQKISPADRNLVIFNRKKRLVSRNVLDRSIRYNENQMFNSSLEVNHSSNPLKKGKNKL